MTEERWEGEAQVVLFDGLTIAAHLVRHRTQDGRWFGIATIDAVVAVSTGDRIRCVLPSGDTPVEGVVTNVTTHVGSNSSRATSIRFEGS